MIGQDILKYLPFILGGGWIFTWLTMSQRIKGLSIDNESKSIDNLVKTMDAMSARLTYQDREYKELKNEFVAKCATMQLEIDSLKKKLGEISE